MQWDCLIIGGGPAGLTAAIYLARFRRSVLLIDAGGSRAARIPESHNHPGFTRGISGPALLARLREQARQYGVDMRDGRAEALRRGDGAFAAAAGGDMIEAARVLLATGITDAAPNLPGLRHAVATAKVRYCPICDGYEAIDKTIGVVGPLATAAHKAAFLRTYSKKVTVIATAREGGDDDAFDVARAAGVALASSAPIEFRETESGVAVAFRDGATRQFDVIYPVLGCDVHSALARRLGARTTALDYLVVNDKQATSVEGLYAAGDVVSDLHQISVGEGHAAIAATAIHNSLPANFR